MNFRQTITSFCLFIVRTQHSQLSNLVIFREKTYGRKRDMKTTHIPKAIIAVPRGRGSVNNPEQLLITGMASNETVTDNRENNIITLQKLLGNIHVKMF